MSEELHYRVLKIVEENPEITQRELADELGVSLGKANYCVKALVDKGWLKMQNFSHGKNRFGYAYLLTPRGISQKTTLKARFLKHKLQEYEKLKTEIKALKNEMKSESQ